jgi:hypothetical protein
MAIIQPSMAHTGFIGLADTAPGTMLKSAILSRYRHLGWHLQTPIFLTGAHVARAERMLIEANILMQRGLKHDVVLKQLKCNQALLQCG